MQSTLNIASEHTLGVHVNISFDTDGFVHRIGYWSLTVVHYMPKSVGTALCGIGFDSSLREDCGICYSRHYTYVPLPFARCAGALPMHNQFFLTSGALYLLVVDLLKFHNDISHRGEALYTWLDVLLCRVPGCAVLVVATHADSFDGDDVQVAAALSFLEEEVYGHLKLKRDEWGTDTAPELTIEQHTDRKPQAVPSLTVCGVVEASGYSMEGLHHLRDEICRLAGEDGLDEDGKRLFPNVGEKVPVLWRRVWAMAMALREGGEPAVAAQSYDEPVVPIDGYAKHNLITKEFALEIWSTVTRQLDLEAELEGRTGKRFALKKTLENTLKKVSAAFGSLGKTATSGETSQYEERVLVVSHEGVTSETHTLGSDAGQYVPPCW